MLLRVRTFRKYPYVLQRKVRIPVSSQHYFKAAVANLEKTPNEDSNCLSKYGYGMRPYPPGFHPEIDTSLELD